MANRKKKKASPRTLTDDEMRIKAAALGLTHMLTSHVSEDTPVFSKYSMVVFVKSNPFTMDTMP